MRRWLLTRFGNAVALLFTIGMGILAGCALSASEAVEEQLSRKRHVERHTRGLK